MTELFLKLCNMSITAGWLVVAILLLRPFLKKTPRWIVCLLWGIVALRLLMPFSFESAFSLVPSAEVIPLDMAASETPAIYSGIPVVNNAVNPLVTQHFAEDGNGLDKVLFYATIVWLAGMAGILLYGVVTYLKLYRQLRVSICYRDNIYICDNVDSPFLLGILRPKIYVSSALGEEQLHFALDHEYAHLKRRDHLWKPLGFLLLTIYWFNPLMWVAYILLCRDIEQACDEKVISGLNPASIIGYSQALAACSTHRRMVMACPVAFGELSAKARIKSILNYKKPAFWIICTSIITCAATAVCFLTNPQSCSHEYHGDITIAATCTETGLETKTCSHCQHSYTVLVNLTAHTYDSGVVTEPSTCTHDGCMLMECVHCGNQKTETIEKTGHIPGSTHRKEPNCAETGEVSMICACCGIVYSTEILPTNNEHDLMEIVVKEATCTSPGEGVLSCTRCDYSEPCTYEQLEHNLVRSPFSPPTCISPAKDKIECANGCGYVDYQSTGETGDHLFVSYGFGYPYYDTCSYCGAISRNTSSNSSSNSLFGSCVGSAPSTTPDFPVIQWDPNG